MGARGTFYALNLELTSRFLDAAKVMPVPTVTQKALWFIRGGGDRGPGQVKADAAVFDSVCDLWNATDQRSKCPVDSAWYAIHCCLTGGKDSPQESQDPRELCVLGGQQLYRGSDHIIAFKDQDQVVRVSTAIEGIKEEWIIAEYHRVVPRSQRNGPEDPGYTWAYFQEVRTFYKHARDARRSVVFHVSL